MYSEGAKTIFCYTDDKGVTHFSQTEPGTHKAFKYVEVGAVGWRISRILKTCAAIQICVI